MPRAIKINLACINYKYLEQAIKTKLQNTLSFIIKL